MQRSRTSRRSQLLAAATLSLATACAPQVSGGDDTGGDDTIPSPDASVAPTQRCQKMDLVFVIDDSGSMAEEQDNLAANFPQFAQVLDTYEVEPGILLDYRVAITTTGRDVTYTQVVAVPGFPPMNFTLTEEGDDGAFRQSCGMTRPWLERTDPDMAATFACAADVGTSGPGLEMQLYASELAFSGINGGATAGGFLRDDALLAIVYLTDEDDCSRRDNNFTYDAMGPCTEVPLASFTGFFDDLKGARGRWATAVIAGPTDCTSEFGEAAAAPRLQGFVTEVGANAVFSSICEGTLAPALQAALDTFQAACETFPDIE